MTYRTPLAAALLAAFLTMATHFWPLSAQTMQFPSPLPDPVSTVDVVDHFIHGSTEAGEIGALGWNSAGTGVSVNALTALASDD